VGGNHTRKGRSGPDARFGKNGAKFFQCTIDALPCSILAQPESFSNLCQAAILEVTEQNHLAVAFFKFMHGSIERWAKCRPVKVGRCDVQYFVHEKSLRFVDVTAAFGPDGFAGGEVRACVKPACQDLTPRENCGFTSEVRENRLRHVLCHMCVAIDLPQCCCVDEIQMTE
jgi:hypothetical protein